MNEPFLKFQDDNLYVYTLLPLYGKDIYKVDLIMTKDIFRECYKKWIEPQESERNANS